MPFRTRYGFHRRRFSECCSQLAPDGSSGAEERIIGRRGAVVIQSQYDAGKVRIIRSRSAELVVLHYWTGTSGGRAAWQVLQLTAAADVADQNVKLFVGAEAKNAAVMIAAGHLSGVRLKGAEADDVLRKDQRRAVPDEAVDTIAQKRRLCEDAGVRARRALGPIEIDAWIAGKVRMQGNAEQTALRCKVHG